MAGVSYITYKISDDKKKIVTDKIAEKGESFDDLVQTFADSGNACRYAVIDVPFTTDDDRTTSKLVFISWIPDDGKIREKMLYAGSKEYLKSCLQGVGIHIHATDLSELDFETVVEPKCKMFT